MPKRTGPLDERKMVRLNVNIPAEVMRQLKIAAAEDLTTVREIILVLLKEYLGKRTKRPSRGR